MKKTFELNKPYDKWSLIDYLEDILLPDFIYDERPIELPENSCFLEMNYLGSSSATEISVLEAICDESASGRRITTTQNAFRILRQHGISNAIVAFTYGTDQWRLSLLTSTLEFVEGVIVSRQSNPRRYSYLLGAKAKTRTPYKYLIEQGKVDSLESLRGRFSVEVVNKQFYDEIAKHFTELVGGERGDQKFEGLLKIQGNEEASVNKQEFAVRLIGRIMFCWFLKEKKSTQGQPIISEALLSREAVQNNPDYYHSILEPLFFELLNTRHRRRVKPYSEGRYGQIPYLNGGLFSPQKDDYYYPIAKNGDAKNYVSISDAWFNSLFDVLESYNFTVDENTSYDIDLSIDPEMLGRIFENLLAEINPETGESAKKSTGSFYTPRDVVDYMVDTSLRYYLLNHTAVSEEALEQLLSYGKGDGLEFTLTESEEGDIVEALSSLTILDPACGSGAFPIGILQKIVYVLQQVDPNAKLWAQKQYSSVTSAELRREIKEKEERGLFDYIRKLGIIRESIFGVDIQTVATEIAKLRCFLSLIVEETVEDDEPNRGIQPLPNLDFKFITANTLIRLEDVVEQTGQMSFLENQTHIDQLKRIRDDYFTAEPDERSELKNEFKDVQIAMYQTTINEMARNASNKYKLLSEWNPFVNKSTTWFDPEWMFGVQAFDMVISNPPYIHLEHIKDRSVFYKSLGFETYQARGDIYTLFYEKGLQLLKEDGLLCYITSNKWMRTAYGKALRKYFAKFANPLQLIDFSGQQIFDATVDTNIILLSKSKNEGSTLAVTVGSKDGVDNLSEYFRQNKVTIPFNTSNSWTILSPIEQRIRAKIEARGTPLKEWDVKIRRGILTGCNEAFIIDQEKRDELLKIDPKSAEIIRPILRGRDIERYGYTFVNTYLINTHNGYRSLDNIEVPPVNIKNFPAIESHLNAYWEDLKFRRDKGITPYNLRSSA